jgi:hypothetical protein
MAWEGGEGKAGREEEVRCKMCDTDERCAGEEKKGKTAT